ncbi:MAG: tetratricopeptide repeat protein [Deltaproteobacteria bacterium]|nr:tetratricopeptide repeat protein [Candidatus Zymogenaceae bacterium]
MSKKTNIDAFYDRADEYMREGRYEEAIELYLKLAEAHPEDDSIVMSLSWAYRDSGRVSDAVRCLEGLLKKEMGRRIFTGFAFDELVRIYREESNYERLIAICEAAVAAQPDDVALLTTLGDAYLGAGRPDRAVEVFTTLTGMEPDAPALLCRLGDAHIGAGEYDDAAGAYDRAADIEPSDAHRFYSALGSTLSRAGEYDRAEKALRRSLESRPDQAFVHCSLGDVCIRQRKPDKARAAYEEAVRLDPASAGDYYNRLGNSLARENHHALAVEAFEKAVAADPRNPFYYLNLVKSCEAQGRHDDARAAYEKARSLGLFPE